MIHSSHALIVLLLSLVLISCKGAALQENAYLTRDSLKVVRIQSSYKQQKRYENMIRMQTTDVRRYEISSDATKNVRNTAKAKNAKATRTIRAITVDVELVVRYLMKKIGLEAMEHDMSKNATENAHDFMEVGYFCKCKSTT